MTYSEALEFLYGLRRFGLRPGLETTRWLAGRCGHPERGLRFAHVAGTNGKGSTCAFLAAMGRAAGGRVGLYTSPHLVHFRERIQVDGEPIPEGEVCRLVDEMAGWLGSVSVELHPTFFEVVTVMAARWFAERRCDLVVWETGLGGRLDATNIVTPAVSIITSIGFDHTEWLGPTLADIAREKAGIIKPGVPVLTAVEQEEPLREIRRAAEAAGARLRVVAAVDPAMEWVRTCRLPLAGDHQRSNAALAVAAAEELGMAGEAVRRGLETATWPGRFQEVTYRGRTLVLDGAHNAPAFAALAATWRQVYPGRGYGLVLAMLADKDLRSAAEHLVPESTRTVVVPVASNRGVDPAVLLEVCRERRGRGPVERAESLASALESMPTGSMVLVTGSLYLVGEALSLMGGGMENERGLNDWSPTR